MRRFISLSLISLTAAACASSTPTEPPDDEMPSYEDDAKADSSFEDHLVGIRNQWGEIIRPDEAFVFAAMAQKINELQRILAVNGTPQRGFHAKVHSCLKAEFRLD